jgi:hypothetical protein
LQRPSNIFAGANTNQDVTEVTAPAALPRHDRLVDHLRTVHVLVLQIKLPPQLLTRQLIDHSAQLALVLGGGCGHAREDRIIVFLHHSSVGRRSRRAPAAFNLIPCPQGAIFPRNGYGFNASMAGKN